MKADADADADADATTIRGTAAAANETDVSAEATISTDAMKAEEDLTADETTNTEAAEGTNVDRGTTMTAPIDAEEENSEADSETTGTTIEEEEDAEVSIAEEMNTEEAAEGTNVVRGTATTIAATTEASGENSEADSETTGTTTDARRRFATIGMDSATLNLATGTTTPHAVNADASASRTITRDSVVRVENLVDPSMIAIPTKKALIAVVKRLTTISEAAAIPILPSVPTPRVVLPAANAIRPGAAGIPIGAPTTFACGETPIAGIKSNVHCSKPVDSTLVVVTNKKCTRIARSTHRDVATPAPRIRRRRERRTNR